jgi:hypothetical protein
MKFRAKINYTFQQAKSAKQMGDNNVSFAVIEFDFQDILGNSNDTIYYKPDFTMRNLVIPWLQEGNIPELIKNE